MSRLVFGLAIAALCGQQAHAQEYPFEPIVLHDGVLLIDKVTGQSWIFESTQQPRPPRHWQPLDLPGRQTSGSRSPADMNTMPSHQHHSWMPLPGMRPAGPPEHRFGPPPSPGSSGEPNAGPQGAPSMAPTAPNAATPGAPQMGAPQMGAPQMGAPVPGAFHGAHGMPYGGFSPMPPAAFGPGAPVYGPPGSYSQAVPVQSLPEPRRVYAGDLPPQSAVIPSDQATERGEDRLEPRDIDQELPPAKKADQADKSSADMRQGEKQVAKSKDEAAKRPADREQSKTPHHKHGADKKDSNKDSSRDSEHTRSEHKGSEQKESDHKNSDRKDSDNQASNRKDSAKKSESKKDRDKD